MSMQKAQMLTEYSGVILANYLPHIRNQSATAAATVAAEVSDSNFNLQLFFFLLSFAFSPLCESTFNAQRLERNFLYAVSVRSRNITRLRRRATGDGRRSAHFVENKFRAHIGRPPFTAHLLWLSFSFIRAPNRHATACLSARLPLPTIAPCSMQRARYLL